MKKRLLPSLLIVTAMFSPFSYPVLLADNPSSTSSTENTHMTKLTKLTKPIKWFLNMWAPTANITKTNSVLVLHLDNPTILGMPMTKKSAKHVSLQEFISGWSKGSNSYKIDNPNAALTYSANNKMIGNHIVLSDPVVSGTTLSFNVRTYPASDESKLIINMPLRNVSLLLDPADPAFFDNSTNK